LWFDRDADLNTPATTPSGRIDGMVVANIIGKGAPELTRFWGDGALVREPDVLLFGLERLDPPEQEFLTRSPMRHIYMADIALKGANKSAQNALIQLHADTREFVVHLDTDVLDASELPSVNVPGNGGLPFSDARAILQEIVKHKNLLALDIAQYNPDKDPDGSGARKLVDLLVEVLSARIAAEDAPPTPEATPEKTFAPTNVAPEAVAPEAPAEASATVETSEPPSAIPAPEPEAVDGPSVPEVSAEAAVATPDVDTNSPEVSSSQSSS